MSNAMSRSKSRWKGALLAAAAIAVISPLAAKAQSFQVSLSANPLGGGTSPNKYSGKSNVYIDPYDTDTLYVYGTVTGTAAPSASYVDGLAFTYFNVNGASTGASGLGSITAVIPTAQFDGGANPIDNPPGTVQTGNGVQLGSVSPITSTSSVVVGSTSNVTQVGKVRSDSDYYWSSSTGSGSNVVVNGDSVSFLLETLTYTPNSAAIVAHPSTPASPNSVAFNVSIPSTVIASGGVGLVPANYFVGLPSLPTPGTVVGSSNTSTNATSSPSNITLTNALPGDANLDGTVNFTDFGTLLQNYNKAVTGGWTSADFNDDGVVNFTDFGSILQNYNLSLGGAPSALANDSALISAAEAAGISVQGTSSVPEPASLGLLTALGAAALVRRRRV